jgi:CRISPR-associated protein Csb1
MTEPKLESMLADTADAPAALVLRQFLSPVEGRDGVIFPPTFAAKKKGDAGDYNIDSLHDGENVCLVDSIGSQANRIEPMFAESALASLVPQIVVTAGSKSVNLLEAGHRAGDAIVRCSPLKDRLHEAFQALKAGDAVPLAKVAPTSLVFGVWDSRDTQAKAPRLLSSTIRAFNVDRLTRSAMYTPAADYSTDELLGKTENDASREERSQWGYNEALATGTHGGVIARGDIRRESTLQLAALRLLRGSSIDDTAKLRNYLLGLALLAFSRPAVGFLRQGCNLVLDAERPASCHIVYPNGKREPFSVTFEAVLRFATNAAMSFGVGASQTVSFDPQKAKDEMGKKKGKAKQK